MALPKNPKKYSIASMANIEFQDFDKVIWHITQGKYRTIEKTLVSPYLTRKIRLPDNTMYTVFEILYMKGERRYCGIGEEKLFDAIITGCGENPRI